MDDAPQVHTQGAAPVLGRRVEKPPRHADTGIVHQHVQHTVRGRDARGEPLTNVRCPSASRPRAARSTATRRVRIPAAARPAASAAIASRSPRRLCCRAVDAGDREPGAVPAVAVPPLQVRCQFLGYGLGREKCAGARQCGLGPAPQGCHPCGVGQGQGAGHMRGGDLTEAVPEDGAGLDSVRAPELCQRHHEGEHGRLRDVGAIERQADRGVRGTPQYAFDGPVEVTGRARRRRRARSRGTPGSRPTVPPPYPATEPPGRGRRRPPRPRTHRPTLLRRAVCLVHLSSPHRSAGMGGRIAGRKSPKAFRGRGEPGMENTFAVGRAPESSPQNSDRRTTLVTPIDPRRIRLSSCSPLRVPGSGIDHIPVLRVSPGPWHSNR